MERGHSSLLSLSYGMSLKLHGGESTIDLHPQYRVSEQCD